MSPETPIASPTLAAGALIGDLQVQRLLRLDRDSAWYCVSDVRLGSEFLLREYLPTGLVNRGTNGVLCVLPGSEPAFAEGLNAFQAEARLLARFDHPGLARVLRYLDVHGTACMLLPWSGGEWLDQRLAREGRLDTATVRTLFLALTDALAQLQAENVLHLGLQPDAILLQPDNSPRLARLSQARATADLAGHAKPVQAGSAWAAPELFNVQATEASAQADVGPWADHYSLAAVLHHCLAGSPPPTAAERQAALTAGRADPLTPALSLAPQAASLADAIDQGLRLAPQQRPPSAQSWRREFESLDWRIRSLRETPASSTPDKRQWLPRILLGTAALAMLVTALLLWSDRDLRLPEWQAADRPASTSTGKPQAAPAVDAEERRRWEAALEADTVLGYRQFLADFPDTYFRPQAEIQLGLLDERLWAELSTENTREAYSDYLQEFPSGLHAAEALARIEEIDRETARLAREAAERARQDETAWSTARAANTLAALDSYLRDWPTGAHAEEAQTTRRALADRLNDDAAASAARNVNGREAWQAYIDAFPKGAHVAEALAALDALDLRPGKRFRDCSACPEMMVLPAGTFNQGTSAGSDYASAQEQPGRLVRIPRMFAIGVHEVTFEEWDACVAAGACPAQPTDNGWGRGRRPVILVSWNDAQSYVQWLSETTNQPYRLPSESEWEYAARAGTEGEWPGGSPSALCEMGNVAGKETEFRWRHTECGDTVPLGTAPAGAFVANAFGLYDMVGNVAEWTADCMNLSYLDAPTDGSAWTRGICSSHMARGGSWVTGSRDLRLSARFNLKNGDRNDFTGFRVARDIPE